MKPEPKKEKVTKPQKKEAFNPVLKERNMKLSARDEGAFGIDNFLNDDEK